MTEEQLEHLYTEFNRETKAAKQDQVLVRLDALTAFVDDYNVLNLKESKFNQAFDKTDLYVNDKLRANAATVLVHRKRLFDLLKNYSKMHRPQITFRKEYVGSPIPVVFATDPVVELPKPEEKKSLFANVASVFDRFLS